MKAKAYKITCRTNSEAIGLEKHLESDYELSMDTREGKSVYYSKEWWDQQQRDQDEFQRAIEDFAAVFETDYTPEIEVVDYDFDPDGQLKFGEMLDELDGWRMFYREKGLDDDLAVKAAHQTCKKKYGGEAYLKFTEWMDGNN